MVHVTLGHPSRDAGDRCVRRHDVEHITSRAVSPLSARSDAPSSGGVSRGTASSSLVLSDSSRRMSGFETMLMADPPFAPQVRTPAEKIASLLTLPPIGGLRPAPSARRSSGVAPLEATRQAVARHGVG